MPVDPVPFAYKCLEWSRKRRREAGGVAGGQVGGGGGRAGTPTKADPFKVNVMMDKAALELQPVQPASPPPSIQSLVSPALLY